MKVTLVCLGLVVLVAAVQTRPFWEPPVDAETWKALNAILNKSMKRDVNGDKKKVLDAIDQTLLEDKRQETRRNGAVDSHFDSEDSISEELLLDVLKQVLAEKRGLAKRRFSFGKYPGAIMGKK